MAEPIVLTPESLANLYGDAFYLLPGDAAHFGASTEVAPQAETPKLENVSPKVESQQSEVLPKVEVTPPAQPKVETPATSKPGITWRPKPASKVLFVLQSVEFSNKELTELLKKIVESLGIGTEYVGFGQIDGPVGLEEFDTMPNPHAVVFDNNIWGGKDNPVRLGKGEVFFTHRLASLQNDNDLKRQLWVHLKKLKDRLQ